MGVGKAALHRSYRRGAIKAAPYIPSVKVNYGDPKGRALSSKEVALLLTHASDHMRLFIYIIIGTACRPEAAFDLTGAQLDFENRLIELNPHGRAQTKKIRPIVKMPESLALLLQNAPSDHLIKFRGKRVKCVRTAWRNLRAKCKLDDAVQPYSLRHTMARHMRKSGVSAWETAAQLGHKSREYRTTELYTPLTLTIFQRLQSRLIATLMIYLPVTRQSSNRTFRSKCHKVLIKRKKWSGRRDSNPRPSPWQGDALPLSYARSKRRI